MNRFVNILKRTGGTLIGLIALSATTFMTPTIARAQSADVAAIKAIVEKETTSWYNQETNDMIDYWANVPEAGQLVTSPEEGAVSSIQNTKMSLPIGIKNMIAGMEPDLEDSYQNTDYLIRVKGDAAFVQFEQVITSADGQKEYAHETRYLEKMVQADGSGQWKIVHVGAAFYKP